MRAVFCEKLTLVGVGLLGGSLGLAVRRQGLAGRVEGYVRRTASVAECERAGAVDRATTDLAEAVRDADFIVVCTPLAQMRELVGRALPAIKRGAVLTDVGSVKHGLVEDFARLAKRAGAHYVGSNPMAGAEKSGVAHARADLFTDAVCVITPTRTSSPLAVGRVRRFWRGVGGRVVELAPSQHDRLVSRSSHLPHVVAVTLVNQVLRPGRAEAEGALCANGFRDSTRIASGSPEMWRDIVLANRVQLSRSLREFMTELGAFVAAIRAQDADKVSGYFERAKAWRDAWVGGTEARE